MTMKTIIDDTNCKLTASDITTATPWMTKTVGVTALNDWAEAQLDNTWGVYELKLVNGKRIVKEFGWRSITKIEESDGVTGEKSVSVTFHDGETINVACSIRMFMSLIKKKYNSWATGIMTEQITNGTDT